MNNSSDEPNIDFNLQGTAEASINNNCQYFNELNQQYYQDLQVLSPLGDLNQTQNADETLDSTNIQNKQNQEIKEDSIKLFEKPKSLVKENTQPIIEIEDISKNAFSKILGKICLRKILF